MTLQSAAGALDFFMHDLEGMAVSGALVATRLSGVMVFAPVFSSPAIAPRMKAGLVIAMTFLLTPVVSRVAGAPTEITLAGVGGELAVGLSLGLALGLLTEMLNFAATLLSMEFSFSLVNLMDPNTQVETPVLGQLLGWMGTLVLLGAGLHRTLLAAVMGTFVSLPPGHAILRPAAGVALAHMAGVVFTAGVQLASPVIAAALSVELAIAFMSRMAPQLPSGVLSVPVKTLASYVVLIASLAVWPWFLECRFGLLLEAATHMVGTR